MWENSLHEDLQADFLEPDANDQPETPNNDATETSSENGLVRWLLLFILKLQARHYIPALAINSLLKFLYVFFSIIGLQSNFVAKLASSFPKSIYMLQKYFGIEEEFTRFVVCKKCYSVCTYETCIDIHGLQKASKKCSYRLHANSRSECGALLLKSVTLSNSQVRLYPFKVFCYQSLNKSLQKLVLRPGFIEHCELWRSVPKRDNELQDIYDGKLWNEFQHINGNSALADSHVYAVMINVDWFQPFKHVQASVGAMYLTILNLPRHLRFKRKNIILLGIIPGPSEPPKNINQYLSPFVTELLELFTGIEMFVYGSSIRKVVRCLLLGVACDMPAGRKVCGFLSHSALLGCTKCYKVFSGGVGNKDYSGFCRNTWKARTNSDHRTHVHEIQEACTVSARNCLESKYGCRYSVLLKLPYFDPTRMLIVDPMHNLFLGSAKHILKKLWMTGHQPVLSSFALKSIQSLIDSFCTPAEVGRIPRKIETGFSNFTANQYKNWVTLYSIPCLQDFLDNEQLECWRHFVLACRILCKQVLTTSDVVLADSLLLQFCKRTEQLYGTRSITPNMHMHCHLKSTILDYGPVY